MKRIHNAWLIALAVLGMGYGAAKAADEKPSMAAFVQIRSPSHGRLAPDGSFFYIHNPTGVHQLYCRSAVSGAAAEPQQLTEFEDGISTYWLSPDGTWLAISAATGGSEQSDIYLLNTGGGSLHTLFADPETVYGSVVWRGDSKAFAYRANADSKSDFNIYVYTLAEGLNKKVFEEPGAYYPADFSPDGKRLMVIQYLSSSNTRLFEVNLETGDHKDVTPGEPNEEWFYAPVGYLPGEDHRFLLVTDRNEDLRGLRVLQPDSRHLVKVLPEYDGFYIDGAVINDARTSLAVLVNDKGYSRIGAHRLPEMKFVASPRMEACVISEVSFAGETCLFTASNAKTPGTIFRWAFETESSPVVSLTRPETGGVNLKDFPLPILIKYPSEDGKLEVPAFLYLPPGAKPGQPMPFIVDYHGGPEGQFRPVFRSHLLYFLSRGFGILAPNVRGSSGYGREYLRMDDYRKRMDSVSDGVAAARWLVEKGFSKPGMIAAFGGSYGGFMVVACVAQAPDVFGAACDIVGIVNFQTFLERTRSYRRKLREAEYGPLSDPEFLRSISPIHLVDQIKTPMLIAHGKNDPRVPVQEAEQLFKALKDLGREPQLVIYEDEGHGFRKEANRIDFFEKVAEFFQTHLKAREASQMPEPVSAPAPSESPTPSASSPPEETE